MAINAEDFDFEGLGSQLTKTIIDSFNGAVGQISFSSLGTSLTAALKTVDMSKIIEDSLTKNPKVNNTIKDIQKKLVDGFYKTEFKVGNIVIPDIPTQTVEVMTKSVGGAEPKAVEQPKGPSIDIGPFQQVGNLVREFVNLTEEASKKTKITSELYNKIVKTAEQLVAAKRMEKSAVDDITSSLQQKVIVPPIELSADVTEVNTSAVDQVSKKRQTVKADVEAGQINITGLEKTMSTFLVNLKRSLTDIFANVDFGGVEKAADRVLTRRPVKLIDSGESIEEVNELLSDIYQLDTAQKILAKGTEAEYKFAQKRLDLNRSLSAIAVEDLLTSASKLKIQNAELLTETQLRTAIKNKIVSLYKEKEVRDDLVVASDAVVASYKGTDVSRITAGLTLELGLTEDIVAEKAQALLQQNLLVDGIVGLTEEQKKALKIDSELLQLSKDQASAAMDLVAARNQVNEVIKKTNLGIQTQELTNQLGLLSEEAKQKAQAIIQQRLLNGQSAELTNSEKQTLFYMDQEVMSLKDHLGLSQKVTDATDGLSKAIKGSNDLAGVLEGQLYTQLGLTQDLTREKAQAIILDGIAKGLSEVEISKQLEVLKNEDKILQKTRERVDASKDLEAAADAYAKAVRQSDADLQIKSLIVGLRLTEDEVAQEARLLALKNQQLAADGKLTAEELKQMKANNGLLLSQVEQLKNNNKTLRHRREEVELVEHVAHYQKEINEELEKYSMGWKKTKATISAILKDPALAKGVFFASAKEGLERLTHSMHEFMDVGMSAGEGVSATFRTMSVASIMGLSKSKDVLTSMVQDYGSMNVLSSDQLDHVGKIATKYGLAGKEAFDLTMAVSRMPGQTKETATNFDQTVKSVAKMKGVIPSQVMKEMAKNTANMAIYTKGGAESFAKAAASAKKMGVEVGTMLNAANKTLDFENSINAQMEASALLGKEINMDKLRQAALSGDANAILQEQQNLIRQAGDLDSMNVLQKQKLAELMGVQVEDLAKIQKGQAAGAEASEDQAGTMSEIAGTTLKIGEGLFKGFGAIFPMITGIASLMQIMNVTSMSGMLKGMKDFVVQSGKALVNLARMAAAKVFGGGEGAAKGLTSFADKRKMVLDRQAAGKGLTPSVPKAQAPAGAGAGAGPTDQASKVGKLKSGDLIKGAAALLIVAAALYVAAKAFQEFASVKWEDVGKGLVGLTGLALVAKIIAKGSTDMIKGAIAIAILGAALIPMAYAFQLIAGVKPADLVTFGIALVGFSLAAAGIGLLAAEIIIGAVAIGILGVALIPMAAAFKMVEGLDPNALITFGIAIVSFAGAAAGLAFISPFIIAGAYAIGILGLAMLPFAAALALAAPATQIMATVLKDLVGSGVSKNLGTLTSSLFGLAKALGAVGIAGMLAMPALGVVAGLSALGALGGGGAKPAAPAAAKAVAPVPAAPAVAAPAAAPAPAPAAKAESSADTKALMDKLDKLISVLQAGGTINMDGKKVADIVQRNIRTVKFAD